ncbi:MAG: hypothetical protein U0174_23290 [Polyangiaceae bacterium]
MARIHGVFGKPWLDLLPHLPMLTPSLLHELDAEIRAGLPRVPLGQTGATLKWMGVVAPWQMDDGCIDAMDAIGAMSDAEFETFVSLGDYPRESVKRGDAFGDETDAPFSTAQIEWLTREHGVYFPWKVCYHLLENDRWEDKHHGAGKSFAPEVNEVFPKSLALIRSLPFREIGRVVIFGVQPGDHAPFHRDSEPSSSFSVAQSISIDPRGDKGLCLKNAENDDPVMISSHAYWFNDMDYHGILPAPAFRYSLRIDGVFVPSFARDLERKARTKQ